MCTVSYIPPTEDSGFILTSNRDERIYRPTLSPEIYQVNGAEVCFPKDFVAGGSWIAASQNGRLACLLNGAYYPHEKKDFHTHSRGKVLIDLAASQEDPMFFFSYKDLSLTEPFTVVTIDMKEGKMNGFTEFIWDGTKKYLKELDASKPYLWSSVTLYTEAQRNLRRKWFNSFLLQHNMQVTAEQVFAFHSGKHTEDESINLVMKREEGLKTVSITQVVTDRIAYSMRYLDLYENTVHLQKI
ncbi:MAG: NRDE family protein [Bacteroidales bacterium]|nr:NRDE family protein [Bacteroidales bacterium]